MVDYIESAGVYFKYHKGAAVILKIYFDMYTSMFGACYDTNV